MCICYIIQYFVDKSYILFRLFVPKQPNDQQDHCTHAGECSQDILKVKLYSILRDFYNYWSKK